MSSLPKAAEREMLTALAARKEALLDKLKEKMDELKTLCMQEAVSLNLGQKLGQFVVIQKTIRS